MQIFQNVLIDMLAVMRSTSLFMAPFKQCAREDFRSNSNGQSVERRRIVGRALQVQRDQAVQLFSVDEWIIRSQANDVLEVEAPSAFDVARKHVQFAAAEASRTLRLAVFLDSRVRGVSGRGNDDLRGMPKGSQALENVAEEGKRAYRSHHLAGQAGRPHARLNDDSDSYFKSSHFTTASASRS